MVTPSIRFDDSTLWIMACSRKTSRTSGFCLIQRSCFPLASMQLAAWLHHRRGGQVFTMFFHSSELHPGATRLFPTEETVHLLVREHDGEAGAVLLVVDLDLVDANGWHAATSGRFAVP